MEEGMSNLDRRVAALEHAAGDDERCRACGALIDVLALPQWVAVRTALLESLLPFPEARAAAAAALMAPHERRT
jgi:hypothetical protein